MGVILKDSYRYMSDFHTPVLLKEAIEGLAIKPGGKYIDATLGGGGHGIEIVKRGGTLLGIDLDEEAINYTEKFLSSQVSELKDKWRLVKGNFGDIEKIAKENSFSEVDGILFDLGVSSHQIDTAERGFSYRFEENELDLRFDQNENVPASEIVKHLSEDELYEIFAKFGEEKRARAIAHALVSARHLKPIVKVGDLAGLVAKVVPKFDLNSTLSRVFQALRIAVNDETQNLSQGLRGAQNLLAGGGRLAVISVHSLEDRVVKQFLRQGRWKILTKKPLMATPDELHRNIRARSAKLRIAQKL